MISAQRFLNLSTLMLAIASVAGTAFAAFPDTDVKLYTGCLASGGNVMNVKEGNSPSKPCAPPSQTVKLSGGDITKILVTGAWTGGGDNGAVTIGLDASKTVPTNCSNGQVPKWNGSAWICGNDNDTQYSAGTGLNLNLASGSFSIAPPYRLPNIQDASFGCQNGDTVVIKNGQWSCAAPNSLGGGIEIWSAEGYGDAPGDFESIPGVELTLPPGKYLVLLSGTAKDSEAGGILSGDGYVTTECKLVDSAGRDAGVFADIAYDVDADDTPITGNGIVTSDDRTPTFRLECKGFKDFVVGVTVRAIKIGVAH